MLTGRKEPLLLTVVWHLGWHLVPHQLASCRCPVYKAAVVPDWARFSGLEWYEVLNNPGPLDKCVVRKYYADNGTMKWVERDGPYGDVARTKKFDFVVEGRQQFLKKDKSFFQQILDTDLYTWALVHICSEGDGKSKLALTLRDPLSMIPADITARVSQTLQKVGISDAIKWTRSPCMIDRTLRLDSPPSGPVVMYPAPEAVQPFDQSRVADKANRTDTSQQADAPYKTGAAFETSMLHVTILPVGTDRSQYTDQPHEIGTLQQTSMSKRTETPHVTIIPQGTDRSQYTDRPQEIGTLQQNSMPQQTELPHVTIIPQGTDRKQYTDHPQEIGRPQQTSMPQQTKLVPIEAVTEESLITMVTTPWIPYVNEEESW